MHSPAPCIDQECLEALADSIYQAMAATHDAKRVKVVAALSAFDIDVDQLQMKVHKDARGSMFWISLDGDQPRINLTPAEPFKIVFGLDMTGSVERRSFNSDEKAKPNESLGIRVNLNSDLSAWLSKLDKACKDLFEVHEKGSKWMSLVAHNEKYGNDTAKLTVGITGRCTALKVLSDDETSKGEGWEFIKTHAEGARAAFGGAEAKAVVKLRIWTIEDKDGRKAGLSLDATQLFIKPLAKVVVEEEDAFPEW